jgi:predicted Rossmann fold nucleotide-binding protein DprA/Smf involved in DNA uptake
LSGRDIVAELMWELDLEEMPAERREQQPLTTDEERLLACFDSEPTHIDTLLERSGMSSGEVSLHLMILELSGAVRPLRGGMYEKLK